MIAGGYDANLSHRTRRAETKDGGSLVLRCELSANGEQPRVVVHEHTRADVTDAVTG